ncbi:MAG: LysM peptidoglycan-binding domain-containing protein [Lentisphaeria bacterium]|nr:LysM peptidoglycan-binding domain-containing protein [Lentisphaeria bacterium]
MNTKLFTTITVLAAVSGSTVLFTGCQPEWEPMPPGVYIQPVEKDPERVDVPKTDTVLPAPSADLVAPAAPAVQEPLPVLPPPPAVVKPVKKPAAPGKARKVEVRKDEIRYVVKKGDSLARIAYRYGLKIKTLKEYNGLKKNVIHPKQILLIPPTSSADKVSANLKSVKGSAKVRTGTAKRKGIAIPADGIHKVKARENFTTIARLYGIRVADMVAANPGVDSARLKIGQKLNIVAGAAKGAAKEDVAATGKKDPVKKTVKKTVKKPEDTRKVEGGDDPAADGKGADNGVSAPEDDLFKDIKSPEEAAAPAAKDGTAAPAAVPAAKTGTPAETTPADNTDILGSDDNGSSAKVDKVVPTSDGRIQITLAEATTLENLAAKYQTTAELLRKENSSLPASGELKAGTVIMLGNAQ